MPISNPVLVAVLAGMVFLIFSILGVQLFAGLLWSCNDDTVAGKVRILGLFPLRWHEEVHICLRSWLCNSTQEHNACCRPAVQSDCVGTFVDPATGDVLQREWTNAFYNFDNASSLTACICRCDSMHAGCCPSLCHQPALLPLPRRLARLS